MFTAFCTLPYFYFSDRMSFPVMMHGKVSLGVWESPIETGNRATSADECEDHGSLARQVHVVRASNPTYR
jgi:hypothetical protein